MEYCGWGDLAMKIKRCVCVRVSRMRVCMCVHRSPCPCVPRVHGCTDAPIDRNAHASYPSHASPPTRLSAAVVGCDYFFRGVPAPPPQIPKSQSRQPTPYPHPYHNNHSYVKRREYIDERVIWVYLIQILEGLKALHERNVLHRGEKRVGDVWGVRVVGDFGGCGLFVDLAGVWGGGRVCGPVDVEGGV